MKKFAVVLALALASTGLIGSAEAATPAPHSTPTVFVYPGGVGTKVGSVNHLPKVVKHKRHVRFSVVIKAKSGNAMPAGGTVRVWVFRNGAVRQVRDFHVRNGVANVNLVFQVKGKYTLHINYLPVRSSVWKYASTMRYVTAR